MLLDQEFANSRCNLDNGNGAERVSILYTYTWQQNSRSSDFISNYQDIIRINGRSMYYEMLSLIFFFKQMELLPYIFHIRSGSSSLAALS